MYLSQRDLKIKKNFLPTQLSAPSSPKKSKQAFQDVLLMNLDFQKKEGTSNSGKYRSQFRLGRYHL